MILITGGLGFLGCNLAKLLCDNGERVLLTKNRNAEVPPLLAPFMDRQLKIIPLDITSLEKVSEAIQQFGVKSIIHAAVRSEKGDTSLYQALHVNVTGTINTLDAARRAEIKKVIFISSEAVYQGIGDTKPFQEEEKLPIASDRFIPGTKKAGEILCHMYSKQYGMEVVSVRATRMYGPLYRGVRYLAGHMVENAAKGIPVALGNHDPAEAHDIIYVRDAARAVIFLLKAQTLRHQIYNVGFGRLVSLSEFAEAIKKLLPQVEIHLGDDPGPLISTKTPMDINTCVDISRIHEETGFTPEYDPYRGVEHYLNWVRYGIY